jgi:hypothetical protein
MGFHGFPLNFQTNPTEKLGAFGAAAFGRRAPPGMLADQSHFPASKILELITAKGIYSIHIHI